MDEIRKRFSQLENKGISVKACISEMLGVAVIVLLGCIPALYMAHADVGTFPIQESYVIFILNSLRG
jgi:hypothetical protein